MALPGCHHSLSLVARNHAVRSTRYHYIRYRDGTEELYDMSSDPHQWRNLAHKPGYAAAKEDLKKWLPKTNAQLFRGDVEGQK